MEPRTSLREFVRQKIIDAEILSARRIHTSRGRNIQLSDLPTILIYTPEDKPNSTHNHSYALETEVELVIEFALNGRDDDSDILSGKIKRLLLPALNSKYKWARMENAQYGNIDRTSVKYCIQTYIVTLTEIIKSDIDATGL